MAPVDASQLGAEHGGRHAFVAGADAELSFGVVDARPEVPSHSPEEILVVAESESQDAGEGYLVLVAEAEGGEGEALGPVDVVSDQHFLRVDRNEAVRDGVGVGDAVPGAEHVGQVHGGLYLGGGYDFGIAGLGLPFAFEAD